MERCSCSAVVARGLRLDGAMWRNVADVQTVDAAAPERGVGIAVFLAIGHPQGVQAGSIAKRGTAMQGSEQVRSGATCEAGLRRIGAVPVIGESGRSTGQEGHVTTCVGLNPLAICLRRQNDTDNLEEF